MTMYLRGREFVEEVRPILEAGNLEGLISHLQARWCNEELCGFLAGECDDARKVALFCLSLVGVMHDCPAIAPLLKHRDPYVSKLAENTLWSIWFRGSDETSNLELWRAVQKIGDDELDSALACLSDLLERRPDFAEAYNQRAIVLFLQGDYEAARQDLYEALKLNPLHFAAVAGLGHCYAAEGELLRAMVCYRQALAIHPRAEGLSTVVAELTHCPSAGGPANQPASL